MRIATWVSQAANWESTPARIHTSSPQRKISARRSSKTVPDVIAPGLKILFCGINPGLYTAAVGHHFGRPGNRFWRAIHESGFTPRQFHPSEQSDLLEYGYGITNVVPRATATADQLGRDEIVEGGRALSEKVERFQPSWLAVLGIGAYRIAFARPKAQLGMQDERIGGTRIWALPNPSGLNAHYQPAQLAAIFAELRDTSNT